MTGSSAEVGGRLEEKGQGRKKGEKDREREREGEKGKREGTKKRLLASAPLAGECYFAAL